MTTLYALDFNDPQSDSSYSHLVSPKRVTEAEYWEKYYQLPGVIYEWHNGYLEEKAVSKFLTSLMSEWFSELLRHFLRVHPIAEKTFLEMGFRLTLPGSTENRKENRRPDLGVVLNSNSVPLLPDDSSYKGTYDLCIEAISESTKKDIKRDTVSKRGEYAEGGVKEYYILDGYDRYLEFYRLNAKGVYMPIKPTKGGIIKSKVLPGFQFRRQDLFNKPSPEEMIADKVYKGFVLPGYSEAKEQASEEKRARQKAEAEIVHLKALLEKLQKAR
jgi:Uma2 family endonuclease